MRPVERVGHTMQQNCVQPLIHQHLEDVQRCRVFFKDHINRIGPAEASPPLTRFWWAAALHAAQQPAQSFWLIWPLWRRWRLLLRIPYKRHTVAPFLLDRLSVLCSGHQKRSANNKVLSNSTATMPARHSAIKIAARGLRPGSRRCRL